MPEFAWTEFFQVTKDEPHWGLMKRAAEAVGHPGCALDLGCGAGRDTRYLLENGWQVTAVDREAEALAHLKLFPRQENLLTVQSSFEAFDYQAAAYDLVTAQFALPFISKHQFAKVFSRIMRSIRPGGVFSGQFFGPNDSWNTTESELTFHTHQEVTQLFERMHILEAFEVDRSGRTAWGYEKHWHVFHVIAQKDRL